MSQQQPSPSLLRNARREAWIVFAVWALALVWTVGWYWLFGMAHDDGSVAVRLGLVEAGPPATALVLGFPSWVFWGLIAPWIVCSAYTVWFGMRGIVDDDLGGDPSPPTPLPKGVKGEGERHGH